jgi:hypothetical protein
MTENPDSVVTTESLAYAFYGGVPWEKLTADEQAFFAAYVASDQ